MKNNKIKLLVLKGLPASGKSTYAKELVAAGWKRVNKDDLRAMIDSGKWSKKNEEVIKSTERGMAASYLQFGHNVVVDDTNFAHEGFWKQLAESLGAEFEVKFFDTPVMECIERDAKRGEKSVGAKVIMGMYNSYLKPKEPEHIAMKSDAYIFDIDGTLALMDGRSPYDYSKVSTDKPNQNVINMLKMVQAAGNDIVIVSGRDASCQKDTLKWLEVQGIRFDLLIMRSPGDVRNDAIVKKEIYRENILPVYNVLGVFDDRNRVVDMWRSLGLTCYQVAYGFF